jgi:endonuclease/exonuclease/phosphatase family metal-dependent hydrolase
MDVALWHRTIDYVFVKNGVRVVGHMTIDDRPPVSDHRAVLVKLAPYW